MKANRAVFFLVAGLLLAGPASAMKFLTEDNPPLNVVRDGEVGGIATAVVREMAKRASVKADVILLRWSDAFSRAQAEADACVYSTVRNNDREKQFVWIGPIARGEWSLFGREGFSGDIKKIDQMTDLRVGAFNDARAGYLRSRGFKRLVVTDSNVDLAAMLTADPKELGKVDLWFTQSMGAREIAERAGVKDLRLVFSALMSQDYWLACNPAITTPVVNAFRAALSEMRKDGTFKQLTTVPR